MEQTLRVKRKKVRKFLHGKVISVVTLSIADSLRGQELRPRPAVIAQPYPSHRWRAPLVAVLRRGGRSSQCRMFSQPVVLEHRQSEQSIPRPGTLGEGVSLACQGRQTVPEHAIEPLDVYRRRLGRGGADGGSSLYFQQPAMLVVVFDGLGEGEPLGNNQGRAPDPARPRRAAVDAPDRFFVGSPTVGAPPHRLSSRAGMDLRDGFLHQAPIPPATAVSNNKAAPPALYHQAPPIASLRRVFRGELFVLL